MHLLAVAYGIKPASRNDTLDDIINAHDAEELLTWLRQQPLLYYCPKSNYALVHAGIAPQWDIQQALQLNLEVESALKGEHFKDFLKHMYGDNPDQWQDNLRGWERLRVITNHFTRMRLCDKNNHLDLHHKHGLKGISNGLKPWFSHPHRKTQDINILFGHWAALEGKSNEEGVFALDTGCVWGGRLTMMRLEDHRLFSCSCDTVK